MNKAVYTGKFTTPAGFIVHETRGLRVRLSYNSREVPKMNGGESFGEVEGYAIEIDDDYEPRSAATNSSGSPGDSGPGTHGCPGHELASV